MLREECNYEGAKSVNSGMKIPRKTKELKSFRLRNAYEVKPVMEYNPRKSVPLLGEKKMYAGLGRSMVMNVKNLGIKSLRDNKNVTDDTTARDGFQNLMFNGIPFISDSHCPANHVFFLNENHLFLWYHSQRNFKSEPFQKPVNQQVNWPSLVGDSKDYDRANSVKSCDVNTELTGNTNMLLVA